MRVLLAAVAALAFALPLGVLAAAPAAAQPTAGYGLKAGLTSARLGVGDSGGSYLQPAVYGPNAAAFWEVPLDGTFGVLLEAGYHQRGAKETGVSLDGVNVFDQRWRFHQLTGLAAAEASTPLGGGPLRLYVFAGPRLDVLLAVTRTRSEGAPEPEESDHPHRPFVLGYAFGVGVEATGLLPFPVLIELRDNGDVTDAWGFRTSTPEDDGIHIRHHSLDLRLGVRL